MIDSRSQHVPSMPEPERKPFPLRALVGFFVAILLLPLILFLSAGTWDWPMAWLYYTLYIAAGLGSRLVAYFTQPDLLRERGHSLEAEDAKPWDKWLMLIVGLLGPLALIVIAGLDHRNGWSPEVSSTVQWISVVLFVAGLCLSVWAFLSNRFFSGTVRIQTERNHTVVDRGPYALIRHPGYAGGIVTHMATPLMLGSLWALIPALVTAVVLAVRTSLEDRTLQAELSGYAEYARRVRSRLVPGVW